MKLQAADTTVVPDSKAEKQGNHYVLFADAKDNDAPRGQTSAEFDELTMWNRALTAAEVKALYLKAKERGNYNLVAAASTVSTKHFYKKSIV